MSQPRTKDKSNLKQKGDPKRYMARAPEPAQNMKSVVEWFNKRFSNFRIINMATYCKYRVSEGAKPQLDVVLTEVLSAILETIQNPQNIFEMFRFLIKQGL